MEYNPRVQTIPAKQKQRDKRVVSYAGVSSKSVEQLNSGLLYTSRCV